MKPPGNSPDLGLSSGQGFHSRHDRSTSDGATRINPATTLAARPILKATSGF
jgi:hypothetical protein